MINKRRFIFYSKVFIVRFLLSWHKNSDRYYNVQRIYEVLHIQIESAIQGQASPRLIAMDT